MDIEILIPTLAGRERYLEWCLNSCVIQRHHSFGILVSNNGGASSVKKLVESFNDSRIRYIEVPDLLPMCKHWEFMLSHAQGDFLTIIGDDDALMPKALLVVEDVLAEYPGTACVTHEPAQYYWPDYPVEELKNRYVYRGRTGIRKLASARNTLREVVEFREWYGKLPFLYHGFVSRHVLEKIRAENGGVFLRPAPDIFVDLVLGMHLESYVQVEDCLTIGGQGAKSTGTSCSVGSEAGKSFIEAHPKDMWPKYSIASITLQVFEYIEFLSASSLVLVNRNIYWWGLVRNVANEGLLAPNDVQSKQVFNDLKDVINEHCRTIYRLPLLLLAGLLSSYPIFRILRKRGLSRRMQTNLRMRNAMHDFGASNVFDVARSLDSTEDSLDGQFMRNTEKPVVS